MDESSKAWRVGHQHEQKCHELQSLEGGASALQYKQMDNDGQGDQRLKVIGTRSKKCGKVNLGLARVQFQITTYKLKSLLGLFTDFVGSKCRIIANIKKMLCCIT